MIRATYGLIGLAIVALIGGCTSPDYVNLVHEAHAPGYQRVNTATKAQTFYPDTTLVSKFVRFEAPDGTPVTGDRIPVGSKVVPAGFSVEYFAPDGAAFKARSNSAEVQTGRWSIDQFGRGYPQICRAFAGQSSKPVCTWPSRFLAEKSSAKLYRGDITGVGKGRYPASLQRVSPSASIQSTVRVLGTGNAVPITAE